MKTTEYAMGYEISGHAKVIGSDPPPKVSLHRLGGEAPTYFTPDEAERFAETMVRVARAARGKS